MAKNLINHTGAIRDRKQRGYPGGVDEKSVRDIPMLLARIKELEIALDPFARAMVVEQRTNPNASGPLMSVYRKDCMHAKDMLDPMHSHEVTGPQIDPEYLPAE